MKRTVPLVPTLLLWAPPSRAVAMVAVVTTLVATAQTPTVVLRVEVAAHLLLGGEITAPAEPTVTTVVPALGLLYLLVVAAVAVAGPLRTLFMAVVVLLAVMAVQVRQGITGGRPPRRR